MSNSAEQQIYDTFLAATEYVPQVPHGCVELGSLALHLDAAGVMSWGAVLQLPLAGDALRQAVRQTNEVHARVGVPENKGLYTSLPFAFELVRADLASSFPATEKQDTIAPISPPLVERSVAFMQDVGRREFAAYALSEATAVLRSRDIRRGIGAYQIALRNTAERYRSSSDAHARMEAMDALRQSVTDLTRGPLTERLATLQSEAPTGLDMATVAHNLTRWQPSKALVTAHFS